MSFTRELALALRLLWRDYRAGELALIAAAIVIAVAAVTTVGFFTDRVRQALGREANQLLGADLVIASPEPLGAQFEAEARARGLAVTRTTRFPSMAAKADVNVLAAVKVVTDGYPLRGEVRLAEELYGEERRAKGVPASGAAWVDERLFTQLGAALGDTLELGRSRFVVAAIVTHEPDSAIGFLNAAPRVLINEADLPATGLIQRGSRIGYRLHLAGPAEAIAAYRVWALPQLSAAQRIEGVRDARPEIKAGLERAEQFLSLAALLTVVLAAVAIGLATRRFLQRHLDACAMLRCLGASQAAVLRLYFAHFLALGVVASAVGCALGATAQLLLAKWLGSLVSVDLPPPGPIPALHGMLAGLALLLGFALPPLTSLARISTLRVLRREMGAPHVAGFLTYVAGYAVIAALIVWKAQTLRLGAIVLAGFTSAVLAAAALTWLMLKATRGLRGQGLAWRYGVANLSRRTLGTILQVVALGIGMMALLVLTFVRHDLLAAWQASLPADAPNRFIVNIQPEQVQPLGAFFARNGLGEPSLFPMIRGRLARINDRPITGESYEDERARRLVERDFNLSHAERMQRDNQLVAGRWWSGTAPEPQFSVEDALAQSLGMKLGDALTFDVAGTPVTGRITSLRKVDWDTFNVNFFVLAPPGMLEGHPTTFVTSFHLPPGNAALLSRLVREFPNLLLIDVAQILAQVQRMMDQVVRAVQFIFLFTLLAGLTVLYAAIASTQDERLYQASVMRTLGASRRQLVSAMLAEFGVLGVLAGLLAAAGATALGYVIATQVLNLAFSFNALVWSVGAVAGAVGIAAAGYAGTRSVLKVAPLKALRELR